MVISPYKKDIDRVGIILHDAKAAILLNCHWRFLYNVIEGAYRLGSAGSGPDPT
jgi:hypothetical protein